MKNEKKQLTDKNGQRFQNIEDKEEEKELEDDTRIKEKNKKEQQLNKDYNFSNNAIETKNNNNLKEESIIKDINKNKENNYNNINQILNNNKEDENIINEKDIENVDNNEKEIIIPKKANNNKYIYSKYQNNIFYVDETEDSTHDNNKISKEHNIIKTKINNFNNENKSIYKRTISFSENEDIESSENETESYEEELEEKDNNSSLNQNKKEKDAYLLELNDNGLPNLHNDEIISCNINSLLNISVNNGIKISKDIFMITNAENEFPSPFFLNSLINEVKLKNEKSLKDDYSLNLSLKHQEYLNNLNNDNDVLKQIKKYQIFPNRINTKIYFKVNCKVSGNITFIFLYKSQDNKNKIQFTKPFHILVNPLINLNNKIIEINQIQMQSIIPKNIGNLENDFQKYYEEVSLLGFNFIHFHSFQKLSKEENIFILKDQNELNDNLFLSDSNKNVTITQPKQKYQLLLNSIKNLKNKYNIGSITDIILQQTSSKSDWIYQNKDCTYNLKNTPWLKVAYELDKILIDYSKLFAEKKVLCKSAPYINNINDIEEIISEIHTYLNKGELEQFFMISEEKYINEFKIFYNKLKDEEFKKQFMNKKEILLNEIVKQYANKEEKIKEIFTDINYIYNLILKCCINYGYERFGVKICIEFMSIIILQSFKELNKTNKLPPENIFLKDIKSFIEIINQQWIQKTKELLQVSLSNIKETLKYKYLQLNNKNKITQLIDSYFISKNNSDPDEIYLSNGWLMDSDNSNFLYINTVQYGTWYHLKRKINIIKGTIKINYGENIENTSHFLIKHMTEYVSNLAFIFDGLFIDSIRYIPLSILKYFIYIARKTKPSIILISNISNNSNNISMFLKKKYTEEVGINLFVNDLIWNNSINDIIHTLIKNGSSNSSNIYPEIITHFSKDLYSNSFIGENKILLGKYKYLKPRKTFNIIYDIFDDKTYYEKFNKLSLNISISSLMSLLDTPISSNFGFDKLFPVLPRLENENRQYIMNKDIKELINKIDDIKIKGEEKLEVFLEYHPNEYQPFNNISSINSIHLALNYYDYNPNIELSKITNNLYMTKISIPPGKYYYQYLINNEIWTYDNTQPMIEDENGVIYNTIDLRNQNKIILPNLEIFRRELNKIRNIFINKQSEIYFQKNGDMVGIIRIITDDKCLLNNNIEKSKIEIFKNKFSEEAYNEEEQEENSNDQEIIAKSNILNNNKSKNNIKLSKNEFLSKSFEYLNNLDNNIILNENKVFVNSIEINNKNNNEISQSKIINSTKDKSSLNSTNNDLDLLNTQNIEIYDGYAIICFPFFDKDKNKKGKGVITIPGKVSLICGCYMTDKNIEKNLSDCIIDKKLRGDKNEIFFIKDINYLKSIANVNYIDNMTKIEFFKAPQNISFIFKFKNDFNSIIDDLNKNLELILNNGNDLINYLDETDINKLLFGNENAPYEIELNLFKVINESNKINNNKAKFKFKCSGINQMIELIKLIKKTENQDLFINNRSMKINAQFENDCDFINSENDRKIIVQSLYKDIYNSDNYIIYLLDRLSEVKSFNLIYKFMKKLIYQKYKLLPNFVKPKYFEKIITSIYQTIIKISLGKIPKYLLNFGEFGIGLSLTRYQFIQKRQISPFNDKLIQLYCSSKKSLYQNLLGLNIINGIPLKNDNNKISTKEILFSFNSLFLIPKLYYEGKIILKLIGSTMRNGLLPDFIENNTNNYKYNSLDISWLYIRAIKEYINDSQDFNFLKESIYLLKNPENIELSYFKMKDKNKQNVISVENIIQMIFQYHVQGIKFINDNNKLNTSKMKNNEKTKKIKIKQKNENYSINIIFDNKTGFILRKKENIFDNNIKTQTKFRYTTDIEIISLLYDCINFVITINNNNYYPYKDVLLDNNKLSFYQWSLLIKKSFEKEFISEHEIIKNNIIIKHINDLKQTSNEEIIDKKKELIINKKKESESKLNPNILLAIYYSPNLFSSDIIIKAIEYIEKYFLMEEITFISSEDPIYKLKGIKIFDKLNNYQDFSYLYGLYLMIKTKYYYNIDNIYDNIDDIIRYISRKLYSYIKNMKENIYMGIPEIIDEEGKVSEDGHKSDLKAFAVFYELIEKISHIYVKVNKLKENNEEIISQNY